jgi:hypothetical protein
MPIQEATVKGLIIRGMMEWISEKFGEKELEVFYDKFPPEMKEKLEKGLIMPISELPASYYIKSYEAANALWSTKEPDIFQRIAAHVAFKDLSSVMKFFMKVGTPSLTASRFPNAWKHYFNQGSFTIVESSSNQISAALENADAYEMAGCEGTLGWTRKALEHAGAKQLKADHYACRFKGQGNKCLFRYTWK